ncbi:hypothetical protein Dimus_030510, partial [Dionaea muscipula]
MPPRRKARSIKCPKIVSGLGSKLESSNSEPLATPDEENPCNSDGEGSHGPIDAQSPSVSSLDEVDPDFEEQFEIAHEDSSIPPFLGASELVGTGSQHGISNFHPPTCPNLHENPMRTCEVCPNDSMAPMGKLSSTSLCPEDRQPSLNPNAVGELPNPRITSFSPTDPTAEDQNCPIPDPHPQIVNEPSTNLPDTSLNHDIGNVSCLPDCITSEQASLHQVAQ